MFALKALICQLCHLHELPTTPSPVLLLTSNWYHKYSGEFLSNFCWRGQFPHQFKDMWARRTENNDGTFLCRGSLCSKRVQPPDSWWPQHWYVILEEGTTTQGAWPHSQHSAPLGTLTTTYIILRAQALSTRQGDPAPGATLWATTKCKWKPVSSATEIAELQPLWQLFFALQSCSPNKILFIQMQYRKDPQSPRNKVAFGCSSC